MNRRVSKDFITRLEDVVPSIATYKLFKENRGVLPNFNVRGRSTIQSNVWPLVVVDGFPYAGNFNNINPNDIENITILKDAAASSIWGAQSGNGVVVITTKNAKFGEPFKVSYNTNLTIENKPDLAYYPQMNTSDFIDMEIFLFDKGYYNNRLNNYSYYLTPVVQLLKDHKNGKISDDELEISINSLRDIDMRDDFSKYIYRKAVKQQQNIQVMSSANKLSNIFSVGYDDYKNDIVTSSSDRVSFRNQTTYRPIEGLDFNLNSQYTLYNTKESLLPIYYGQLNAGYGNYPYMKLADENGNPLIVEGIGFNKDFRDTVAQGRLLEWNYRPLAELFDMHQKNKGKEMLISMAANYKFIEGLNLSMQYNLRKADNKDETWRGVNSIFQRDQINFYATWDETKVKWNYPIGDYLYILNRSNDAHQGRAQLNFDRVFGKIHQINALMGSEIRQNVNRSHSSTFFGYDPSTLSYQYVNLVDNLPYLNGLAGTKRVNDFAILSEITDRFTAYFANASYTYNQKYIFSASARKDASNLFGVRTNDKGKPFWSLGGSWIINNEQFMKDMPFSALKLRATYGKNGNVNNATSAYAIMYRSAQNNYNTNLPYATLQSPANPSLRWETVGMLNLGLDFKLRSNRIGGTLEYYIKSPKDLVSSTQVDPTVGFPMLTVNSADLSSKGVDVSLNSLNIHNSKFDWKSNLVFAYNRTIVTKSYLSNQLGRFYRSGGFGMSATPVEGADLNSIITYKWAGLDPETGKPRGYVNGEISTNYPAIVNNTLLKDMDILGSSIPLYFGSFRNNFTYKSLDFSFNISFQLGHKFMRKSINYSTLIASNSNHGDYALRWQKPGDELITNVPVFSYPANTNESNFYMYSSALVASASQIKWRDIQIGYTPKVKMLKDLRFYAYLNNIMPIWRENKIGIDPEYGSSTPDPFAASLGINFSF